jgi:ABC-type sulfate transport system permease subunit
MVILKYIKAVTGERNILMSLPQVFGIVTIKIKNKSQIFGLALLVGTVTHSFCLSFSVVGVAYVFV